MSDIVIANVEEYRRGKVAGASDFSLGLGYALAYPRTATESFLAGWMAGWDSKAVAR